MNFPHPSEAFTNPVQYWSDVLALQIQITRQIYDAASVVNPFLPELDLNGASATKSSPARPTPRRAARQPATGRVTARVATAPRARTTVPTVGKAITPKPKSVAAPKKPSAVRKAKPVAVAKPKAKLDAKITKPVSPPAKNAAVAPVTKLASKAPKAARKVAPKKPAVKAISENPKVATAASATAKPLAAKGKARKTKVSLAPDLPPSKAS